MRFYIYVLIGLLFYGCAPKSKIITPEYKQEIQKPFIAPPALEKIQNPNLKSIIVTDERNNTAFLGSLDKSIEYYLKINQNTKFNFGDKNISAKQMADGLKKFKKIVIKNQSFDSFLQEVENNFDVYSSKNAKGGALITGYYAPIIPGSLIQTDKYQIPVYGDPKHRVMIKDANGSARPMRKVGAQFSSCFSSEEISNGALSDEKPLFWVENPAERFFLAIQGSGIVELEDGTKLNIGYAGGNGLPYYSIGKYFGEQKLLPSGQISTQSIKAYLIKLPNNEAQAVLNANPNFVFFKIQDKKGIFGNIDLALTPFASVAMDSQKIPKGALAYIKTQVPYKTESNQTSVPKIQRKPWDGFVMVQDTGGAIVGGGRVDLYCGEGNDAYFYAGQMAEPGEVYLFAPSFK